MFWGSPDGEAVVAVSKQFYPAEFLASEYYVIRIGPPNDFLNWLFGKDLIEVEDEENMPEPVAQWPNAKSVVVALPPDQLAIAIRGGLYSRPAPDHYGSVRITYRAQ